MPGHRNLGALGLVPHQTIDRGTRALIRSPRPAPVGAVGLPKSPAVAAVGLATDPQIEKLQLRGAAKKGAYSLKKAYPSVRFTSGRRNKADQARAMASNVVEKRKWVEKTYEPSTASKACQKWVDDHPDKTTKEDIAAGLLSVLDTLTDDDLRKLSRHLSGDAFDVKPVEKNAAAIKRTIRRLKGLDQFLEKEGGLVRWHAEF